MNIFKSIAQLLADGESFVLAMIVRRSGSAPRAAGTRMVVRKDGSIAGTIGGGILEAQVRDLAREVFQHGGRPVLKKFLFNAEDAGQMGMICGGQVQVLVHFVDASKPSNLELYQEISTTIGSRKRAWFITGIPSDSGSALDSHSDTIQGDDGREPLAQCLVRDDGAPVGHLDHASIQALTAHADAGRPEVITHHEKKYFVEGLCHEGTVYIFGAGHISRKLASLTKLVGFQTVVLDDRHEFANREHFDTADEVLVLDSFERALEGLEINQDSYLVLVTRGHAHDKTVLGQALRTKAGYIGMIGSRRKRDAIYDALSGEGFTSGDFERVRSPVGLDIGAETPEEIAVSIVAEMIRRRAEKSQ